MDQETRIRLFEQMTSLHKKQIESNLTEIEKRTLHDLYGNLSAKVSEDHIDEFVDIYAVKELEFKRFKVKRNIIQRLMGNEITYEYNADIEGNSDLQSMMLSYADFLKIKHLFESFIGHTKWIEILPYVTDHTNFERLSEEEVTWIIKLPNPYWCYEQIDNVSQLLEEAKKLDTDGSEYFLSCVEFLVDYWKKGYSIFADCGELF